MVETPLRKLTGLHVNTFKQLLRRLAATGLVFSGVLGLAVWQVNAGMDRQQNLLSALRSVVDLNRQTNRVNSTAHELIFQFSKGLKVSGSAGADEFHKSLDDLGQTIQDARAQVSAGNNFARGFFEGNLRVLDGIDEFIVAAEKFSQTLGKSPTPVSEEKLSNLGSRAGELVAALATFQNQTQLQLGELTTNIARMRTVYALLLASLFVLAAVAVFMPAVSMLREQKLGYDGAIRLLQERNAAMVLSEENLSAQKRILQSVLNSIGDAVVVFAKDHRLMLQNPAAEALLGPVESGRGFTEWALGLDLLEFVEGRPRPLGALHLDSPYELDDFAGRVLTLDEDSTQRTRYFTLSLQPMTDHDGESLGWIVSFHDISNRVENEIVLRQAKRDAETASRSKSEFLANISHEIRTPMTAILGYSDLLLKEDDSGKRRKNHIRIIRRNAQILMKLIDDILDLSKIEAGRFTIEKRRVDLIDLMGDVVSMLQARAIEKNLRLCVRSESAIPRWIETDATRLRQILINLVGNAIKFTEKGAITLVVSCSEDPKSSLQFHVNDSGCGIPEDAVQRLFSPFAQVDSSASRRHGGAGLGLALSRRLADALGGKLELDSSQVGVGSSFTASIDPGDVSNTEWVEKISETDLGVRAEEDLSHPSVGLDGVRTLLVEDSPENRELLSIYLRSAGAVVETAGDGETGLKLALEHEFDVVLLDIQLPRMDGYQVLEELKSRQYPTPVIALTAHAMPEERKRGLELGFQDYLVKPVTPEGLVRAVREFGLHGANRLEAEQEPTVADAEVDDGKWARASEAIRQVLERFCERLPDELRRVRELAEQSDLDEMQKVLHRLRGSAGSCGFTGVMRQAESLEDAVRSKSQAVELEQGVQQLEQVVLSSIRQYRESSNVVEGRERT